MRSRPMKNLPVRLFRARENSNSGRIGPGPPGSTELQNAAGVVAAQHDVKKTKHVANKTPAAIHPGLWKEGAREIGGEIVSDELSRVGPTHGPLTGQVDGIDHL